MATNDTVAPLSYAAFQDFASITDSTEENSDFHTNINTTSMNEYSEDYVNVELCYDQMDSTMLIREVPIEQIFNIKQHQTLQTDTNSTNEDTDNFISDCNQISPKLHPSNKRNTFPISEESKICQLGTRRNNITSLFLSNKKTFCSSITLKSGTNHLLSKIGIKKSAQRTDFAESDFYLLDRREIPSSELIDYDSPISLMEESVIIDNALADDNMDEELFQRSVENCQKKRVTSQKQLKFAALDETCWMRAVSHIECYVEADEEILGMWLLSEIDHWDSESERIVFILTNSILSARFVLFKFYFKKYLNTNEI